MAAAASPAPGGPLRRARPLPGAGLGLRRGPIRCPLLRHAGTAERMLISALALCTLLLQDAGGGAEKAAGREAAVAGRAADITNVDGEVALIVLRAAGGTCRFAYGAPGMTGTPRLPA